MLTVAAALTSLGIVLATFAFLVDDAQPAFRHSGLFGFFTHSAWDPGTGRFGVLGLAENTVLISLVALFIGVPISLAMAVFVNEYAPQRVRRIMTSAIDLLAAMPSLLFGIWGLVALEGPIKHISTWLSVHMSVLPFFRVSPQQASNLTGSTFQAGVVVGIMIIPIVTSVSRDVMGQVPREQCEGALALGGTRWGMVRDVILPFRSQRHCGGRPARPRPGARRDHRHPFHRATSGRRQHEDPGHRVRIHCLVDRQPVLGRGSSGAVRPGGGRPDPPAHHVYGKSHRPADRRPDGPVAIMLTSPPDTEEMRLGDDGPAGDVPRRVERFARQNLRDLAVAVIAGAAGAGLLRTVLGWHGYLGTVIWWYLLFLGVYFLLQRDSASPEAGIDRVVTVLIWSAGVAVVGVLGWMVAFVVVKGLRRLSAGFFVNDMSRVGPLNGGGGVRAAIVGSVEQVGLATLVVVPLAILTAVYLHEIKGRTAGVVRFAVNALAGLPSIVAGLLIYAAWVTTGHGFSGLAGAMALAVLMLPFVTRTSEEILRTVPDPLREASLALGAPQWRMVKRIVLPTAMAGLITAAILGVALGVGETAPLLLTTSYSSYTVTDPFHGPQSSLASFVYTYILEPNSVQNQRGYTALLVLVLLVLVLFVVARLIGGRSQRKLGRRS